LSVFLHSKTVIPNWEQTFFDISTYIIPLRNVLWIAVALHQEPLLNPILT